MGEDGCFGVNTSDSDDGWLSGISNILEKQREKDNKARKKFNEILGDPDLFISDESGDDALNLAAGTVYWRVKGVPFQYAGII